MPRNNTANVSVGKGVAGGYFYTAPVGTTLPTDYSSDLNDAFVNAGFLTDEGFTASTDADNETFQDLNGDTIESANSSVEHTLGLQFAEMNEQSLKEVVGQSNVTVASGMITVTRNSTQMSARALVLELVLKDGRRWRRVVPNAKVTSWDDMTIAASELVTMPVTYSLSPDAAGNYYYDYIQEVVSPSESE